MSVGVAEALRTVPLWNDLYERDRREAWGTALTETLSLIKDRKAAEAGASLREHLKTLDRAVLEALRR
jgi:hypothetical protein